MHFLHKIKSNPFIACSGGIDSMVLLDRAIKYKLNPAVLHFNHGTQYCDTAEKFVMEYCNKNGLDLTICRINRDRLPNESLEEYWRIERYKFLDQYPNVLLGHNLNDVAETWIWSCLHGQPSLIQYQRNTCVRPLLHITKEEIKRYAINCNIEWYEDPSNESTNHIRNHIRHNMIESALIVNPGLFSLLKRKILSQEK